MDLVLAAGDDFMLPAGSGEVKPRNTPIGQPAEYAEYANTPIGQPRNTWNTRIA
jgi:hypothetical protein